MNKYNNGKIYAIRCMDDNKLIYIGSTIQPLHKRWCDHKLKCRSDNYKEYNKLLYIKMREVGMDRFYIELYVDFPCERREELNRKEGEIIRLIGTLNKEIAGRTQKEYEVEKKENIKQTKIKYRERNKEEIKLKKKEYYEKNKEIFKAYYEMNKGILKTKTEKIL
jgi:hypothetical protein